MQSLYYSADYATAVTVGTSAGMSRRAVRAIWAEGGIDAVRAEATSRREASVRRAVAFAARDIGAEDPDAWMDDAMSADEQEGEWHDSYRYGC